MKTHEFATALSLLARLLKSGPNIDVKELNELSLHGRTMTDSGGIAVNLATLASLSTVDKKQWLALIEEYNYPIETRPRDASRDILGKLLRYLEKNPSARKTLADKSRAKQSGTSPELMKALASLIND